MFRNLAKLCLCIALVLLGNCKTPGPSSASKQKTIHGSGISSESGDAVRLALVQLGKDLPEMSFEEFSQLKTVGESVSIIDQKYSRSLREGLIGNIGYLKNLNLTDTAVVRRDLYNVKADQGPFTIKTSSKDIPFPFTLQAGGVIEIARLYPSKAQAEAAKRFALTDLPYSLENIKKLEPGTYISLPVRGSLAIEVNGNFLSDAFQYTGEFSKFISSSAVGAFSQAAQGTLIAEGIFALQLIRLDGEKIRVRVSYGDNISAKGTGNVDLDGKFRYIYIPSSNLQRVRDIKELIAKGIKRNPLRNEIADMSGRIEEFKNGAQSEFKNMFDLVPLELKNNELKNLMDLAKANVDKAVDQAEEVNVALKDLDQIIFGKADMAMAAIDSTVKNRIEPVIDQIKEHSDRDLDMKASVIVKAEFNRKLQNVADYIFDMKDELSLDALNRAFFSRTSWLGKSPDGAQDMSKTLFYDLAAAESIAASDQGKPNPRVIRLLTAHGEFQETRFGMTFNSLFLKAGFSNNMRENSIDLVDQSGRNESWYSRVWEFNQDFHLGSYGAKEVYSSGFLANKNDQNLENSAYWFAWQGVFTEKQNAPVLRSLEAAHRLLGPLAVEHGIAAIYGGEFPGKVTSKVQAIFHGDLLAAFFDENKADDALLWQALANLAVSINAADVGIPFSDSNIDPVGLDKINGAKKACEKVALYWGKLYCSIFQDDFLQKLHAVRQSNDPIAKLSFFENYYRIGFIFNRLGTKLMSRYFAEVAHLLNMGQSVQIQVQVKNQSNSSREASPEIISGSSREIELLEAMNVIEGVVK